MKNKLKNILTLVSIPSIVLLASCDSNTPLGEQNNVLGNVQFDIPSILSTGDKINIRSFITTRPLDLTLTIQSEGTLSYDDENFPSAVEPFTGISYDYISAERIRILEFSNYNDDWDVTDTMGTEDPADDVNELNRLLAEAVGGDTGLRAAAINYADTPSRSNAQDLFEALSLNEGLRSINMLFERDSTRLRVFRNATLILQVDGSSNYSRVGIPLAVSDSGVITRNGQNTVEGPTGFTFTTAEEAAAEE